MDMLKKLCVLAILGVACETAVGQGVNPNDVGFVPTGIYQHTDIDSVNMQNGNAVIHIPLFGYPQLGSSLTLNYSIIANTSLWQPNIQCFNDLSDEGGVCGYTYDMGSNSLGGSSGFHPCGYVPNASPAITYNESQTWCDNIVGTQYCATDTGTLLNNCTVYLTNLFYVVEPTGEERRLQYDASNLSLLRTTDGSGYLLQINDSQPYYPWMPPTCTYSATFGEMCDYSFKDISGSILINSKGVRIYNGGQVDTNGNSILVDPGGIIIDTVGRVIPPPPSQATSVSTAGCPTLNALYQPASGSATWTVPGPNGQPTTFLLCFANVKYQTNFWGYGPQGASITIMHGDGSETVGGYFEVKGTESVLQSVVLQDGTFWGFTYDAANPADLSSIAYGTLTQILRPEGSSISYQYDIAADCGVYIDGEQVGVQYMSQRTVTDANGNKFPWKYSFGLLSYSINTNILSTATDPENSDTIYEYTNFADYGCNYLPVATTHYTGSSTQNHVLRTENTAYPAVKRLLDPPYYAGEPIIANPFPQSTTVTDEAGNHASTTYSYDSGFTSAMPYCIIYLNTSSLGGPPVTTGPCRIPVTTNTLGGLSFGLPMSRVVYNYDGSLLATTATNYAWQNGPSASNYYSKNLLTLPSQKAVYGGPDQNAPSAETDYSYDGNGNLTSVSKLLIDSSGSSSALTTSTAFNSYGMPISTTDPFQNTTNTTYDNSTELFPSAIQQPTTNNLQPHIDYYSYDANTGNLLWHTDQNGSRPNDPAHTVHYAYADPFGRLTQVLNPPTQYGQGETDILYNDTTWSVTTTVKASPNPSQTSVKTYDSFGRLAQTKAPSGATQETTYDAMGRVASVTNPHFTSPSSTDGVTTYTYDVLGRKRYQYQPDGSYLQWMYSGNVTTSADESGNLTQRTADALGRLTQVVEPGGFTTNYSYDALNNLLTVYQLGNAAIGDTPRTRYFNYDSLSRLLSAFNPETGTASYTYDANSNVQTKTDARGVITTYGYDALNRLLSKSYSDGVTPLSCYQYDSSTNGIGRLANAWTVSASQPGATCTPAAPAAGFLTKRAIQAYDAMGRILNEQQYTPATQANGAPYAPAYTYDLAGNPLTSTNGVGPKPAAAPFIFTNTFDGAGRLQTLTSNWTTNYVNGMPNIFPASLFSQPTYAAFGGLTGATFGSGLTLSRTYDNRLRITGETDTGTGATSATPGSATVNITGAEQSR